MGIKQSLSKQGSQGIAGTMHSVKHLLIPNKKNVRNVRKYIYYTKDFIQGLFLQGIYAKNREADSLSCKLAYRFCCSG